MTTDTQPLQSDLLIIGVGNEFRSDDAAGLLVARELQDQSHPNTLITEASGEGVALMNLWENAKSVILIDAAASGALPGTIHRFDALTQAIPTALFNYSSHAFSVAEAIALARRLDRLPERMIVYGIEGKDFDAGQQLSPEVAGAIQAVADQILRHVLEKAREGSTL